LNKRRPARPAGRPVKAAGKGSKSRFGEVMMKKYFIALAVLLSIQGAVSAQLPQSGSWYFEILGSRETIAVEIDQNDWYFQAGDSTPVKQTVIVDDKNKTIVIPLLKGVSDYYVYEAKEGYVDFYVGGNFNLDLLDLLKNSMNELNGINSVSDEFVEKFVVEMERIFTQTAFLRLKKYAE
jgi:hypothetical protein